MKEWQSHHQTKEFVKSLRRLQNEKRDELCQLSGMTMEQIAIAHIEIQSEIRSIEQIIELTKEEEVE